MRKAWCVVRGAWVVLLLLMGCDASDVVWEADHETGDLSQWKAEQGDGVFNSGTGVVRISEEVTHSGAYALALTIYDADGTQQGARIFRYRENLPEATYSAWFYFPQAYAPDRWWNVFQFKSRTEESDPTWVVNVSADDSGKMAFYVTDHIRDNVFHQVDPVEIPVGEWVHLEAYLLRAADDTGRIILRQDGVTLFDFDRVPTAYGDDVRWSINNYTDNIVPDDATIFVDDAKIVRGMAFEDK